MWQWAARQRSHFSLLIGERVMECRLIVSGKIHAISPTLKIFFGKSIEETWKLGKYVAGPVYITSVLVSQRSNLPWQMRVSYSFSLISPVAHPFIKLSIFVIRSLEHILLHCNCLNILQIYNFGCSGSMTSNLEENKWMDKSDLKEAWFMVFKPGA